jgi:hypothetical protein
VDRKETEAEKEVEAKWKIVSQKKEAYNEALLPEQPSHQNRSSTSKPANRPAKKGFRKT